MLIYDSSMNFIGNLDAAQNGGGSTQPWPVAFPYNDKFILLTFDNTTQSGGQFMWGNLIIKTATRFN